MRIKGFILILAAGSVVFAATQTWHLKDGRQWQKVDKGTDSDFMLAVSDAKQSVSSGKTGSAKKAFAKIKKDYPQIAGADFDAYVKAEIFYSKRKYDKAVEAYDKFTQDYPQSQFYQSALERQYQIATAYLAGQKRRVLVFKLSAYEDGTEIMNRIADKAGDAPLAKNALLTVAQSNEKRGAHYDAYLAWSDIEGRWPTGQIGQDALLGMARTLENDYRGPKFDSKVLESSRSYYDQYQQRYESSAAELQISNKIIRIDQKLAEKDLSVADYYARTESYNAANIYYQKIMETWPDSSAAKTAGQKMVAVEKKQSQLAQKKKKFDWKGLLL
jgi:outer membrane protein assembly factor BamD (BamD/ComL family)